MKLTFLGTGHATTIKNFHTNMLMEFADGYRMLIDCGGDMRRALHAADFTHLDINAVYISHLHADHVGGMEDLAFQTYFDPRYHGKPVLYVSEALQDDMWGRSLSAGLGSLQGQRCTLDTYFDVRPITKNESFIVHGIKFRPVQTIHYVDGYTFALSFGLFFEVGGERVFLTTDTQFAPNQIQEFYSQATMIVHDAECLPFKSGVHAHFDELTTLDPETKAKMYLAHYQDFVIDDPEWKAKAEAAGFRGFIPQGTVFEFNEEDV